jgi:outer membrane receptor protein involved in Fe transport
VEGDGLNVDFRNIANSQPVLGTYKQAFALRQNERNSLSLASLIINWKFDGATLTSISGDQNNVGTTLTDLSAVYNPLLAPVFGPQVYGFVTDTSTRKYTEEIRLESNGDSRIEWLVGLYGAYEKTHELVNLRNHGAPNGLLLGFSPFYGVLPSTYHELSAFGDVTFHITDAFALKLGARESRNSQHYQQFAHGLLVVPTAPAMTTHEDASSDQSVATYLINPSYRLSKHFMLYAKVASGYRPGGPNFHLALGNAPPTFKPDKLWSYELGEKATFLNGRAVLNADIYDIDWSQIQLTVNNGGVNQITNGGDARIKGAELRAAFQITSHFRLMASGSWTDASLTSAVPALGLAQSGARLPISPRNKAALAASYRFNIGPRSGGRVTLSDSWIGDRMAGYAGSIVAPAYHLPGYNTLNLDVAFYMPHGIEIDAFLHNALDRVGQVSATTVANEYDPTAPVPVVLSRPRTIGVQFTFDFGHYE